MKKFLSGRLDHLKTLNLGSVRLSDQDLGLSDQDLGLSDQDLGLSDQDLGLSDQLRILGSESVINSDHQSQLTEILGSGSRSWA